MELSNDVGVPRSLLQRHAALHGGRAVRARRTAQPGDRQDFYELTSDKEYRFLDAIAEKMSRSAAMVQEVAEQVAEEDRSAGERVLRLAEFYKRSAAFVSEWSQRIKGA